MPEGLIYVMAGAVVVSALALVLQLLILMGLYRTSKAMNAQVLELLPRIKALLENAESTLDQSRKQIGDVTTRMGEVVELVHGQLVKVDESLGDTLSRLRLQLERAELMVDDSLTKVHDAVSTVHSGVMKPLREVSGFVAAIRAAFQTLSQGNRPTPVEATQDDEMFI